MTKSQKTKNDSYDQALHYREELVNRNYDNLLGYAISLTKNRADAKELVQQAFFEFFRKSKDREMLPALNARKLLFANVRFMFLGNLRKAKELNVIPFEPQTFDESMGERGDNEEEKRVVVKFRQYEFLLSINQAKKMKTLLRALKTVSKKNQEVLILRYFEGLSNQEIKDKLKISYSSVVGRLANGQNQLRILLNQPVAFWANHSCRAF